MARPVSPDLVVHICTNCANQIGPLLTQRDRNGTHVVVREVPCSGKTDSQYLLRALESGAGGICVVTCPQGACRLAQGNYRAQVRIRTIQRLLQEIGLEPERAQIIHCAAEESAESLLRRIDKVLRRIEALGQSPIRTEAKPARATN